MDTDEIMNLDACPTPPLDTKKFIGIAVAITAGVAVWAYVGWRQSKQDAEETVFNIVESDTLV